MYTRPLLRRALALLAAATSLLPLVSLAPIATPGAAAADPSPPGTCSIWFADTDGNGLWSNPANWSNGVVPTIDDVVCIDDGLAIGDASTTIRQLRGSGSLRIVGGQLTLRETSDIHDVQLAGGTLRILESLSPSSFIQEAGEVAGPGELHVSDAFAWDGGTQSDPAGLTTVAAGANVLVTAGDREWNGRQLQVDAEVRVEGPAAIDFASSPVSLQRVRFVGDGISLSGTEYVTIRAAAVEGSVDVATETPMAGAWTLGQAATLTVNDAAIAGPIRLGENATLIVGPSAPSADGEPGATTITEQGDVRGEGSVWVGEGGQLVDAGILDVAHLALDGTAVLEVSANASSTQSEGSLVLAPDVTLGFDTFVMTAGLVDVPTSATLGSADSTVTLSGGAIALGGRIAGSVVQDGGHLATNDGATIDGDYEQEDGTLQIGVDGAISALAVGGVATLTGNLDLTVPGPLHARRPLVTAPTVIGGFTEVEVDETSCSQIEWEADAAVLNSAYCPFVAPISVSESNGLAHFGVSIDAAIDEPYVFEWETAASSATAGSDFVADSGTASIAPGETSAVVEVMLVDDDEHEDDEYFSLVVQGPTESASAMGAAAIVDDEDRLGFDQWFTVADLGSLGNHMIATGINSKNVVGEYSPDADSVFSWAYSIETGEIGSIPGLVADAIVDVNERGQVLGYRKIRERGGAMRDLAAIPGVLGYGGADINDLGEVAGAASPTSDSVMLARWDAAGNGSLLSTPTAYHYAIGEMNNAGVIVGSVSFTPGSGYQAFRYDASGFHLLPALEGGSTYTWANAINDDGTTVGTSGTHAVSWAADGTITDLGPGVANDINDRGVIVGYRVDDDGPEWSVATLWWNGAVHELNDRIPDDARFALTSAEQISDDDVVAGRATFMGGSSRNVVLEPFDCFICLETTLMEQSVADGQWVPAAGSAVEGNPVRASVQLTNASSREQRVEVTVVDTVTDEPVDGEVHSITLAPLGGRQTLHIPIDTEGMAWQDGAVAPARRFEVRVVRSEDAEDGGDETTDGEELPVEPEEVAFDLATLTVDPRPLVLVHGLWSDESTWTSYAQIAKAAHPRLRVFAIDTMDTSSAIPNTIAENAALLASYVAGVRTAQNAWSVDIVGHSMGGLISRSYIQHAMPTFEMPDDDTPSPVPAVRRLLMLGTPNAGSPCAWLASLPAIYELRPDVVADFNAETTDRRGVQFSVAAGRHVPITCLSAQPGDDVVPIASAINGIQDVLHVDDMAHTSMTGSAALFASFVLPRINGSSAAATAGLRGGAAATATADELDAAAAAASFDMQPLHLDAMATEPGERQAIGLNVPAGATTVGLTIVSTGAVSAQLVTPTGAVVASFAADPSAGAAFRSLSAPAVAGRWVVRVTNEGDAAEDVSIGAGVAGIPLDVTADARQVHWTGRVQLTATLPTTLGRMPGSVVGTLRTMSGTVEAVGLLDDGAHGDGAANDGVYGGLVQSVPAGPAVVTVSIVEPGFQRAASAGVNVTVSDTPPPNRAPVADAQTILVGRDTEQRITLTGLDPDDDEIVIAHVGTPAHGTLSGVTPDITYTPAPGYRGVDSFTFTVTDGQLTSAPATISIEVGPAPVDVRFDGPFPATAGEGEQVVLRARVLDPLLAPVQGLVVTFELDGASWTETTSSSGIAAVEVVIAATPGAHDLRITTAATGDHRAGEVVQRFTVEQNQPPAPILDTMIGDEAGYAVRFVAVANDVEMNAASVDWDFDGDGVTDASSREFDHAGRTGIDHVFPAAYSGPVTVTVTDSLGKRGSATMPVVIRPHRPLGSLSRLTAEGGAVESIGWDDTGRFVLYVGVVPGSANPVRHRLMVLDRATGEAEVASVGLDGKEVETEQGRLSADGRFVAFVSLVPGAAYAQVLVRNLDAGTTTHVSTMGGRPGDGISRPLGVTRDGGRVLFTSEADNLGGPPCGDCDRLYVWERSTGAITLVSIDPSGAVVDASEQFADINPAGTHVAFESRVGSWQQVYVRDLAAGRTVLASVSITGGVADHGGGAPQLNGDGSVVVFNSASTNLVAGDTNDHTDVFVRDLTTGATRSVSSMLVAGNASVTSFSSIDGRGNRIVFSSNASNLVPGDTNQLPDVFLADLAAGTIELLSREARDGIAAEDASFLDGRGRWITCDGSSVMFLSEADNIVPGDVATDLDAFVEVTDHVGRCGGNRAPDVHDGTASTSEDVAVTIALDARDPDGDPLTVEIVDGPSHGSIAGGATVDAVRYTPAANWSGEDRFTFRVVDAEGLASAVATVVIAVSSVNDAPLCAPVSATTTAGTTVTITPSCSDIDGDAVSVVLGTLPSGVTATVSGGSIVASASAAGTYTVPFTGRDASGASSAPVTATIVVNPVTPPPAVTVIQLSLKPNRSAAKPLHGSTVSGPIYAFWPVVTGEQIVRVDFRLDGKLFSVEELTSYDLARTAPDGSAYGLDTTLLANGSHTVQATVIRKSGSTTVSSATFTVANGANAKQLMVSKSANRGTAVALHGARIASGANSYVFVGPTTAVQGAVAVFFLDGKKVTEDKLAAYDFKGTASNGSAQPWKPGSSAVGTHTITVEYRLPSEVVITQSATFTVTN